MNRSAYFPAILKVRSLKSRSQQGSISFGDLEGLIHSLTFFSLQKPPTFLGPWPLSLNHSNLLLFSLFSTTLIYLPPSYKSSYDYSGPTQPIQHNLSSLSPYLHLSVKSFNHGRQHIYRFWGPGGKDLWEVCHAYDLSSPVFSNSVLWPPLPHTYTRDALSAFGKINLDKGSHRSYRRLGRAGQDSLGSWAVGMWSWLGEGQYKLSVGICSWLSDSLIHKEECGPKKARVGFSRARGSEQGPLFRSISSIAFSSQTGDRMGCLELDCGKRETVCPSKGDSTYAVPEEGGPGLLPLLSVLNKTRNLFLFYFKHDVRQKNVHQGHSTLHFMTDLWFNGKSTESLGIDNTMLNE